MESLWTATPLARIIHGDNRAPMDANTAPWVRLNHIVYSSNNAEIGTSFQRVRGAIVAQIFTTSNSGEKEASVIADDFVSVFQNKDFDGVTCYAVKITRIGKRGDEYQLNAEVDFKYDIFS